MVRTGESAIPMVNAAKLQLRDGVREAGTLGTNWRVAKLLQSIHCHSGAVDWNVERSCRELKLGISPAYAAQLFKLHTGQGIREYAKKKRLSKVVERLIATDLPVKAIAAELGYRNAFDLTRSFEKRYFVTPTKFRNANRLRLTSQEVS